jgi:hypothetical protein
LRTLCSPNRSCADEDTGALASRVSFIQRFAPPCFQRQRAFAHTVGRRGAGRRDIGTVIAPDADVKLFVTASVAERARRRWLELRGRGVEVTQAEIERDIVRRDARDMGRTDARCVPAADAFILDTTAFDKEQAIETAIEAVEGRAPLLRGGAGCPYTASLEARGANDERMPHLAASPESTARYRPLFASGRCNIAPSLAAPTVKQRAFRLLFIPICPKRPPSDGQRTCARAGYMAWLLSMRGAKPRRRVARAHAPAPKAIGGIRSRWQSGQKTGGPNRLAGKT